MTLDTTWFACRQKTDAFYDRFSSRKMIVSKTLNSETFVSEILEFQSIYRVYGC